MKSGKLLIAIAIGLCSHSLHSLSPPMERLRSRPSAPCVTALTWGKIGPALKGTAKSATRLPLLSPPGTKPEGSAQEADRRVSAEDAKPSPTISRA